MSTGYSKNKKAKKATAHKKFDEVMAAVKRAIHAVLTHQAPAARLEAFVGEFTDPRTNLKGAMVITIEILPLKEELQPRVIVHPAGAPINGKAGKIIMP